MLETLYRLPSLLGANSGRWRIGLPVLALSLLAAADVRVPPPTKGISVVANVRPADVDAATSAPSPFFVIRAAGAVSGPGDALVIPDAVPNVHYEAELAIVIGRRATRVATDGAAAYIRGYTCGMDGTPIYRTADGGIDWGPTLAGKSADGIAPVGGGLAETLDPAGHDVILRVNGEEQTRYNTRDLVWSPERIVSEVSRTVTLEPGDVIYAGAIRPVPQMTPGDVVEVEITGICTLRNPVAAQSAGTAE